MIFQSNFVGISQIRNEVRDDVLGSYEKFNHNLADNFENQNDIIHKQLIKAQFDSIRVAIACERHDTPPLKHVLDLP